MAVEKRGMERIIIIASVYVSAVVLAGALIGLAVYGIDLASVFLGAPWASALQQTRGTIAIEGALVFITLGFGGIFIFGLMALIKDRMDRKQTVSKAE